jgi:hypothetical protein
LRFIRKRDAKLAKSAKDAKKKNAGGVSGGGGRQRKNEALFFLIFFALFVSLASSFWH